MGLGIIEKRFADIIWSHEPIASGELVKLCAEELDWKKSTTYTVLKKLCEKGYFKNENGIVTSIISQEEFYASESDNFVKETFKGSLPAFIAAFSSKNKLTKEEIVELQELINKSR